MPSDYLEIAPFSSLPVVHSDKAISKDADQEEEQFQLAIALSLSETERAHKRLNTVKSPTSTERSGRKTNKHQDMPCSDEEMHILGTIDLIDYEQKLDRLLQGLKEFEISSDYYSSTFHQKDLEFQDLYSDCLKHRVELMQSMNKYKSKMDELVQLSSLFLDARTVYQDILRLDETKERIHV